MNSESFVVKKSPKAVGAADAIINCLASKGLTYAEAVEALDVTKEKLGEKAVIIVD